MGWEPLPDGSPDELERTVLDRWERTDLFRQTLEATRDGEPFVFYEGPPTANGRPGIHHVFARTIKDLICRFRTMSGRSVVRIAGWDTHGLPVEISVEKELEISGKPDIEAFGVAAFNERCRESVFRYKTEWESLSNRIGYWLDYEHPYITYEQEYIESVWWLLKELWTRDLLYEGHKVLPYCGRCGTSLSSHELAMGYADHHSPSIYVLFPLRDDDRGRQLLVWTTTPWTLPSNVAVAVNPEFTYLDLDVDGRRILVERSIAQRTTVPGVSGDRPLASWPVMGEVAGADLIGRTYEPLLDVVPIDASRAFRVVGADFVTSEEGTGLVHLAPAFGADDYETVRREGLAFVNPVDEAGRFRGTTWDAINGLTVFEANDVIAGRLGDRGRLFGRYRPRGYEHSYPFCWRCDSPLIYYARRSWFVRTGAFRDRMVELNRTVHWHPPEVGRGRFGEWLDNNVDWALSRDRYWGTPLPAWICEADPAHRVVIGSYEELVERRGEPLPPDFDPHKPFIDAITFPCGDCRGTMRRVGEVIDAWFDSGAMPYAQWHYPFENADRFATQFPADFICEGLDQTRGWFYSLLAIATGVMDQPAYRNVIVNGLVLDAEGRKMSKRLGNVVDPWEAVSAFGADAIRVYLLASSQVWLPKRFDPEGIPEVALGFLTRLRNSYNFLARYAPEGSEGDGPAPTERSLIDRWLLARLGEVVSTVREAWEAYDVRTGLRTIMEFCDDELSNWYIRLTRPRFWAPDSIADPAAVETLRTALVTVTRLLAPAAPFLSDAMHHRLTGTSVHLAPFPVGGARADRDLVDAMALTRRLASLARYAREVGNVRVRQPLAAMKVAVPARQVTAPFRACLDLLAAEVNVRTVEIVENDADLVRLRARPNFRTLGKVYGRETPRAAAAVANLPAGRLAALEAGETVTVDVDGETLTFRPDDVVVEREVASDWLVQSDGPLVVALDPVITDELRQEGVAREIVNRVQRIRRDAGYTYRTRIRLGLRGPDDILAAARALATFIAGETLARSLEIGEDVTPADRQASVDLDGQTLVISMVSLGEDA